MVHKRREVIREMLRNKPFVSYGELCELFPDVSGMTIRRDIDYFVSSDEAVKVRGGARSKSFITSSTDEAMSRRMYSNVTEKEAIAFCASSFLETGRSVFLDSGSTVQSVAKFIPNERFTFTTTNPALALELCKGGQAAVNLVGGRLDRDYQSVSGPQAMRYLADVNIDIAILSPSGFSAKSGFTGGNYSECELKRCVADKASTVIMLMDHTKIERSLPYTFCTIDKISVLITDKALPEELSLLCEANGTRVICTENQEK